LCEPFLLVAANFVKPFLVISMEVNPLKELQRGQEALELPGVGEVIPEFRNRRALLFKNDS
jgi:hypothetical protein